VLCCLEDSETQTDCTDVDISEIRKEIERHQKVTGAQLAEYQSLEQRNLALQNELGAARQQVTSLMREVEEGRRHCVRQEGYSDALKEQLREAKLQADHFADGWRSSERRRLVLIESLAGRALVDALLSELRRAHPDSEERTDRHLLLGCECVYCRGVFQELHSFVSSQVMGAFGVKDLRAGLCACNDRFCAVAHPPGMSLHSFETLHDPKLEYTLRALSLRQAERAGQARLRLTD
jgi:hypothetical protein